MAILLGLGAALTYGAADFLGGLVSKRTGVFGVVLLSQLAGAVVLAVVVPIFERDPATSGALVWGAASGVAGGVGVLALYRGLAIGRMSVVAPTTGVIAAAVPVLAGLLLGERPSAVALLGAGVALVAVALVSRAPEAAPVGQAAASPPPPAATRSGLSEALVAGCAFGAFFILLSRAGDDAGLWPLVGTRIGSLTTVVAMALLMRESLRPAPGTLRLIAVAGVLDIAANLLFLLATRVGLLSLVAVLTSMYPGATVVLARVVLDERLARLQVVGLGCAAMAVVLIAGG
jgi:drug/metabolite transporter (DMT)-like permease